MNNIFQTIYNIFFNKTTYYVHYENKPTKLIIKKDSLKVSNQVFPYSDIERFGFDTKLYQFFLHNGDSYSLSTSKAREIYKKVYDNCTKLADESLPLGVLVEPPYGNIVDESDNIVDDSDYIVDDSNDSDTLQLIPVAQVV